MSPSAEFRRREGRRDRIRREFRDVAAVCAPGRTPGPGVGVGAEEVHHRERVAPWVPWEIRRADLDSPRIRGILNRLRETGKLFSEGTIWRIKGNSSRKRRP